MLGAEPASARSPERIIVRLSCSGTALPDRDATVLCQHMVQSLASVIPRAAFRQVGSDAWQPTKAGHVSVALTVADGMGALHWQVGPTGALETGPTQPFPDQPHLRDTDMRRFTDMLVDAATPMLTAVLR